MDCVSAEAEITIMIDDISDIAKHYNSAPENEDQRLQRHQLEFELTWCYLAAYLPPTSQILEIGAATGGYTLPLAKAGHTITAVDMSETLLEWNRKRISDAGLADRVSYISADARDLAAITKTDYDAVLLMGPLYHLVIEADRQTALRQASARLQPGGLIVSAFISRFGFLSDMLSRYADWIERQDEVQSVMSKGRDPENMRAGSFRGYFATPAEIVPLHEQIGFETLAMAGVEPIVGGDDDSYNRLTGTQRALWLELLYAISREPSIIGASRHLLYIGRKT